MVKVIETAKMEQEHYDREVDGVVYEKDEILIVERRRQIQTVEPREVSLVLPFNKGISLV